MKTKEYSIFEKDEYGNKWFIASYSGHPDIQKMNAERLVNKLQSDNPDITYVIEVSG